MTITTATPRMRDHVVRTHSSAEGLQREEQLAWAIAEVASDRGPVDDDVQEMIINRVIDNAAVAAASLSRDPVIVARAQALAHAASPGATVFGAESRSAGFARVGRLGERCRRP